MASATFILNLFAATMLLLFAVYLVRTSIERSLGPSFKRILTEKGNRRISASIAGIVLAVVMQSATATALLATGFAASGLLSFVGGMAVVLGADFGSALVILLLSFDLSWLVPFLMGCGGWLFLKSARQKARLMGRFLLGVSLILLSLQLIGAATASIREGAFVPAMVGYLETDYLIAFLLGAGVTFLMHSSVAAILMCATFANLDVISPTVGISLILGANLGSATLPVWLSRGMDSKARRIPFGNLILRGASSLLLLIAIQQTQVLLPAFDGKGTGHTLVLIHLIFNGALVFVCLPFLRLLEKLLNIFTPVSMTDGKEVDALRAVSALDQKLLSQPSAAIGCLKREILRMSQIVEVMFHPVMELYETGDSVKISSVRIKDKAVNSALDGIRCYATALGNESLSKSEKRNVRELVEYAINVEMAGDVIAKRLLVLAQRRADDHVKFSTDGWDELTRVHKRVCYNMSLASNVLVVENIDSARVLLEGKSELSILVSKSRKKHLKRLHNGSNISIESSDIHLETLRELKEFNSLISTVGYPVLYRNGQLLESRLITEMPDAIS